MKRICAAAIVTLMTFLAYAGLADASQRKLTILVYMCGSNLESGYGSATADLDEMLAAEYDTRQVTVLVMTGGTSAWMSGYDATKTQILEMGHNRSRAVWSSDVMNMGRSESLVELLNFGQEAYPAENYALILWNHGGGPLEGVCWDELFSMDSLSLSELTQALDTAHLPGKLSWIGFDACLMGSVEVAAAMAPYAEYMIASQEMEPAQGWNYAFLNGIESDENGAITGRRVVDAYFANEDTAVRTLSCVNLSAIEAVQTGMDSYFTPIGNGLSRDSFAQLSDIRLSTTGFGKAVRGAESHGYDLVDLRDLVSRYSRNTSGDRMIAAIDRAVVYSRSSVEGACGLSVYHPFENKQRYTERWRKDYLALSFSEGYTEYVNRFGAILTGETLADWSGLALNAEAAVSGQGSVYSLSLTPDQAATFSSAQLIVLAAQDLSNGVYGTQITALEGADKGETLYSPVYAAEARVDENGLITATYGGRALYAVDEVGRPVLGPLAYQLSEDGSTYYVHGLYSDESGRVDSAASLGVMFGIAEDKDGLRVVSVHGYDSATKTYSSRIPVAEASYTDLEFYLETREMPADLEQLPGFETWASHNTLNTGSKSIRLPMKWQFRFFADQMSASQLYAAIQVTDSQHETHMTRPVAIVNPNLENIAITPRSIDSDEVSVKVYFLKDTSPMAPGLNLAVKATNLSQWTENIIFQHILLNDRQIACPNKTTPIYIQRLAPHETKVEILHIEDISLIGLEAITSMSADVFVQLMDRNYTEQPGHTTMRFEIDNCDLSGIAPASRPPIAETNDDGLIWSLISLEEDRYGDIRGLLRVQNDTNDLHEGFLSFAADSLFIDGPDYIILEAPPHSEAYVPFILENSALLHAPLTLNGRQRWYWMAQDDAMIHYGLREIRDLQIFWLYGTSLYSTELHLNEPWPIPNAGAETVAAEGKALMSGEVEASLERVILAENGIGLRLVFVNHRNAPVGIAFGQQTLNGQKPERDAAPNLQVPANGRAIYAFSITDDRFMQREERITRVGFSFQINGEFSSEAAHILIDPNAETGYLSPDDYATEPVTFYQPVISFKNPEQYTEGQYALSVKGLFLNGSQDANVDTWYDTDQTHLELTLNLTNLTDTSQYYKFSNFVVNGQAMTDVFWMVGSVESGGSAASTRKINLEQLRGVDHIADISCEMTYYEPDHYEEKTTVPLRFEVKDCDVTELTPEAITPLCSGFDGGLNWEILSLTPDPNGGFTALLRASNQGPEAVSGGYVYMAVDDVVTGHFLTQALQPGMHQYFTVSFDDEIRIPKYEIDVFQSPYAGEGRYYPLERHVLEHRGVSAITQIQLFGDLRYSGQNPQPGRTVRLELPAAVPLQSSEGADTHMHPMREGELSIWQGDMLIGDNGVALVLNVINGTDQIIELKPAQLQLNGLDCPNYGTYYSIVAMPHTQRVQHISILTEGHEDEFQKGRVIREVTITLETQSGSSFTGRIALDQAAPLGAAGGLIISGSDMYSDTDTAENILMTMPAMDAESVYPVRLAPALDAEQLARFESGTATVMIDYAEPYLIRDRDNPDADPEFLPTRQQIAMAELVRSEDGVVAAAFSGLAWVDAQGQPLEYYALDYDGEEGDYLLALGMGLYEDPDAALSLDPEISLDDSSYTYAVTAAYLIHVAAARPEITGYLTEAYSPSGEEITDQLLNSGGITLAMAETRVNYYRDGEEAGYYYERIPVIAQKNLRFIALDDMPGRKYVLYDVNYTDGSSDHFYAAYPDYMP